MHEVEDMLIFPRRLEEAGIIYMVTGAVAGIIYGEPRLTHVIDIVVEIPAADIGKLFKVFGESDFYMPPAEVIQLEQRRESRGQFNIIDKRTGLKADIYLKGEDRLHRWALSQRRQMVWAGVKLWVAPPEYVIIRKLQYYREGGSEKHGRDIRNMLEISRKDIDQDLLWKKITENGLQEIWQGLRDRESI